MRIPVITGVFAVTLGLAIPAFADDLFPDQEIKMAYTLNCAECHGRRAEGSMEGPALVGVSALKRMNVERIEKILGEGVSKEKKRYKASEIANPMPGMDKDLTKEEINSLSKLVKSWNK